MRDFLFDARSGLFIADVAVGWAWGAAELDPEKHVIIRADLPPDVTGKLRSQMLMLADKGDWLTGNIWRAAAFKDVPEEARPLPRAFLNLRTGNKTADEDTAWANARVGDVIFVASAYGDNPPGWAFTIESLEPRKALGRNNLTLQEAQAWTS